MNKTGFYPTDILLPNNEINLSKWSVVACDQFTSQPEYWEEVEDYVGKKPSTLNLIYPECYLNSSSKEKRIKNINDKMKEYLDNSIFCEFKNCFILVKRTIGDKIRYGLVGVLDLEEYDYSKNSKSLIRATEQTILDRIPPRKEIRKEALIETPHIMVLISDKEKTVIEPLTEQTNKLQKVYDFELMKDSGRLEGFLVNSEENIDSVNNALNVLYDSLDENNRLLYAMGDGNHSFATAKSCWEDIKTNLSKEEIENHPARFCLVELENIFDDSLTFEPINRVLFNVSEEKFLSILNKYANEISFEEVACKKCIDKRNKDQTVQGFGYCTENKHVYVRINKPLFNISACTIQAVLDELIAQGNSLDYVHGLDFTDELGSEKGNIGIFLPAIPKETFFESIIKNGSLPRKTFSIGEAFEKKFYMECRKISKNY